MTKKSKGMGRECIAERSESRTTNCAKEKVSRRRTRSANESACAPLALRKHTTAYSIRSDFLSEKAFPRLPALTPGAGRALSNRCSLYTIRLLDAWSCQCRFGG